MDSITEIQKLEDLTLIIAGFGNIIDKVSILINL